MEDKKKLEIEDVATSCATNIRLQFNEYAMEKYGVTPLKLKKFYEKYDNATAYYAKKNNTRKIVNTLSLLGMGAGAPALFAAFMLSPGSIIPAGIVALGVGIVGIINGCSIPEDVEYSLKRKNPYIEQGTKLDEMAHDYCKMKKLINEKA